MFAPPRLSPLLRTRIAGGGGIPGESSATPAASPGFFTVAPSVLGAPSPGAPSPGGTPSSDSGYTPGTIDPFDKPFPGASASPPPSESAPSTPPGTAPPVATPPPLEAQPYVNTLGLGGVSALKAKLGVVSRAFPSLSKTSGYPLGYPLPSDANDTVDERFTDAVRAFQRWANTNDGVLRPDQLNEKTGGEGSASWSSGGVFLLPETGTLDRPTAGRLAVWYEEALKSPAATNTGPRATANVPEPSSSAGNVAAALAAPETKVAGGGLFLVLLGGLVAIGLAAGRK